MNKKVWKSFIKNGNNKYTSDDLRADYRNKKFSEFWMVKAKRLR